MMKVVYGAPKRYDRRKAERLAELYPLTWEAVLSIAWGYERMGRPGELARQMQRVESELMITGAAARFIGELPTTPLATVHDSLLVPPDAAPAAERTIREAWRERFGFTPRVKVTSWTGG